MKRSTKISLVAAILVLITAGVAIAAWQVSGTGSGKAKAGKLTVLTVNEATPTVQLYPNANGRLYLDVTNPNDLALVIKSVAGNGAISSDTDNCGPADVTFTDQSGLSVAIGAKGTVAFDVPGVHMVAEPNNACQGATFTIPVTVTASTP